MNTILQTLKTELSKELTSILDYWMQNAFDNDFGGFVGEIDGNNQVVAHAKKGAILNARILWTFSSAYRLTRNQKYLATAIRAYEYILKYFIDEKHGGVFWELNADGSISNGRKQIYALSFTIYGFSEYYHITKNEDALNEAIKLFKLIEDNSYDRERNGYMEALSHDWKKLDDLRLSEKDANEPKTMNTHLHILEAYTSLYRIWPHKNLEQVLENLIRLFLDRFVNKAGNLGLFFDNDWNLKSSEVSYGHDIECSWLLYQAAEALGNRTLIDKAAQTTIKMAEVSRKGLDKDGGLFNAFNPASGLTDTDKHWWSQAEAMLGFYNAFQISNDPVFLQDAGNCWTFIKTCLIDQENGEWFWRVDKSGKPYNEQKAGFWKCPYHNARACMELIERIK